jgi:hypothetical protein
LRAGTLEDKFGLRKTPHLGLESHWNDHFEDFKAEMPNRDLSSLSKTSGSNKNTLQMSFFSSAHQLSSPIEL